MILLARWQAIAPDTSYSYVWNLLELISRISTVISNLYGLGSVLS